MVTASGVDQPGIVAAVTTPLADVGCNLEDATSTILRGHFAMMVVVSGPDGLTAEALAEGEPTAVYLTGRTSGGFQVPSRISCRGR